MDDMIKPQEKKKRKGYRDKRECRFVNFDEGTLELLAEIIADYVFENMKKKELKRNVIER